MMELAMSQAVLLQGHALGEGLKAGDRRRGAGIEEEVDDDV
jgi:hypothetical protein